MDSFENSWENMKSQAEKLSDAELAKHAAVSDAELQTSTGKRCYACFCCAAWYILTQRRLVGHLTIK